MILDYNRLKEYDGISVVTTTYNEANTIRELVYRIRKTLRNISHEIIVVDDSSPDGTYYIAKEFADIAIKKKREGQTKGLFTGISKARYRIVITIDADLENPPELIPKLLLKFLDSECDIVVASRTYVPRISERIASIVLRRFLNVRDIFSNFRVIDKKCIEYSHLRLGETFGLEILLIAKHRGCKICEYYYDPPPRRSSPRIGGILKANLRILWAFIKSLIGILVFYH